MAARKPLVRKDGRIVQLPAGDTLAGVGDFLKDGSVQMTGAIDFASPVGVNNQAKANILELGTATSNFVEASVVGSNNPTIDYLNDAVARAGAVRVVRFDAVMTLAHNTGRIILPGAANIVARVGDRAEFHYFGPGTDAWECIWYNRADGTPLVAGATSDPTKLPLAGGKMTGAINEAVPASMAIGTSSANAVFIDDAAANTVLITGSGTLTFLGIGTQGNTREVEFTTSVTLQNTSRIILPGGADIVTQPGDTAKFRNVDDTNIWKCVWYQRKNGRAIVESGSGPANTDALPEGVTNLYFTAVRVLGTVLAGFASSVGAVTAADTILAAIGKLEGTKAPLASPALTGAPTAPTAAAATNNTQVATTAFANNAATTAANSAAAASVPVTSVGAANGVAPLGSDSKIASAYLPSYVDDVLEYANLAAFPAVGESGKIYIALDTNREYRWSGSTYIQLVASPGTTDNVPEGTTNQYFTAARVLGTVLAGLSLVTGTAVVATDSILVAIGKLQAQSTAQDTAISGKEPTIAAGAAGQYWNGLKVFTDFAASVRSAVLTGLSLSTSTPVVATDTALAAIGKLQAQITALGGVFRIENIAATSVGQTSFAVPNGYIPGTIFVFFKGPVMAPADFTATDGVNVVLTTGAESVGDILTVGVMGVLRAQDDALLSYTVSTLPSASANARKVRWCTDASGGPQMVVSNGTNWIRVQDNTVVTV